MNKKFNHRQQEKRKSLRLREEKDKEIATISPDATFILSNEREKWLHKWYGNKITARALGELKENDSKLKNELSRIFCLERNYTEGLHKDTKICCKEALLKKNYPKMACINCRIINRIFGDAFDG